MSSVLFSALTFLLGLLLGNWLAIGREKRAEFNQAAVTVRAWLLREIAQPAPPSKHPSSIELDTLVSCLPWWRRRRFLSAYRRLVQAQGDAFVQDPQTGDVSYPETGEIIHGLKALLPYTARR